MTTQPTTEMLLPSERLEAYGIALEFHRRLVPLARQRGLASLRDQLMRAADSVVLNLAEGAGRMARDDKRRFYESRYPEGRLRRDHMKPKENRVKFHLAARWKARRLDLLRNRQVISPSDHEQIHAIVIRLYQILSRLTGPPR